VHFDPRCSLSGPFVAALLLLCFLIVGIQASGIPVDVVRVKSSVNSLFDPACVPMRNTTNKLYLIPKRIVSVVGVPSSKERV